MKDKRQDKILELIVSKTICTQEELLSELEKAGFSVTQATVSRDMKELALIKERDKDGAYHYITGAKKAIDKANQRLGTIFHKSILNVGHAGNMASIKCRQGMASAACAILDSMKWDGVVGTLAGDDTIFVLMRSDEDAAAFAREALRYLNKEKN